MFVYTCINRSDFFCSWVSHRQTLLTSVESSLWSTACRLLLLIYLQRMFFFEQKKTTSRKINSTVQKEKMWTGPDSGLFRLESQSRNERRSRRQSESILNPWANGWPSLRTFHSCVWNHISRELHRGNRPTRQLPAWPLMQVILPGPTNDWHFSWVFGKCGGSRLWYRKFRQENLQWN